MFSEKIMQNRSGNIDFIKAVAIIFVIGIHSTASALYDYTFASRSWGIAVFYRSIVAPAVPLFFMCSGALLFNKSKVIKIEDIFKKYIVRMITALFFWASIYESMYIIYRRVQTGVFELEAIKNAIKNIIYFNHNYQLYYIYIMVLFYIFTPIVKIFINNAKQSEIKYFLIVWAALGIVLPTFIGLDAQGKFNNLTQYIAMHLGYASIGYGVLGYYINTNIRKTKHYFIALFIGFIISFGATYLLCLLKNDINIVFWGGMSIGVMLMAYGFFGFVVSTDLKIYSSKIVENISKASFCIFLVHDIFLKILFYKNINIVNYPDIINVPIFIFIVFIPSYIIYEILKRIKYINKYLI